jgi:hypothetical protein
VVSDVFRNIEDDLDAALARSNVGTVMRSCIRRWSMGIDPPSGKCARFRSAPIEPQAREDLELVAGLSLATGPRLLGPLCCSPVKSLAGVPLARPKWAAGSQVRLIEG